MKKYNKQDIVLAVIVIVSIACGLYVGGYLMLILPIVSIAKAIDAGTVTATLIVVNGLNILLSGIVGLIIMFFGTLFGILITSDEIMNTDMSKI